MRIEFVELDLPSRRRWAIALTPWLIVAALWGAHLYLQWRIEQLRVLRRTQEAAASSTEVIPTPSAAPPYLLDAQEALKRAAQPEADALKELETVAVAGVQLKSIDVNPAESAVVVELEASDDKSLGDYIDQLNVGMPKPMWHIRRIAATGAAAMTNPMSRSNVEPPGRGLSVTIAREL